MKNTLLLLILLPLLSFGQSKKDLKARIYSMQLDSAKQAELISDQQSIIVKTEAEIEKLTIQVSELNSDLSEAQVEADAIQEQLKLTKDSEIELKGEVSILQTNLQITQDSLEFLSNAQKYLPDDWNRIATYLIKQQEEGYFCETEEGKLWLNQTFQNRVFRALSGDGTVKEMYTDGHLNYSPGYYSHSIEIRGDWMYLDGKRTYTKIGYTCWKGVINVFFDDRGDGLSYRYSVKGDYFYNPHQDHLKFFPTDDEFERELRQWREYGR